jgi:hypothetical protein
MDKKETCSAYNFDRRGAYWVTKDVKINLPLPEDTG